jgi:hypothetical protein
MKMLQMLSSFLNFQEPRNAERTLESPDVVAFHQVLFIVVEWTFLVAMLAFESGDFRMGLLEVCGELVK